MQNDRYELGLVSVSFRPHSPLGVALAARAARLSCIEWGSDIHAPATDHARLEEVAAIDREYDLTCSSYGTYFRLGVTPIEELHDYIAAARILGTRVLRLWCGNKSGAEYTEDEKKALFENARAAERMARAEDVLLCFECHRKTFTERKEDALELMEHVASPHMRMYWQPFQWKSVEENIAYAAAIAPYVRHIHVFQWKGKDRFPLKEGFSEWKEYLKYFPSPRTLLLEFMPDGDIATLPSEADALRIIAGE